MIKFILNIFITAILLILHFTNPVVGQSVQGGQQGSDMLLLTPDSEFNESISDKDIRDVPVFGFDDSDHLKIIPTFNEGWTWLAAFNIPYRGSTINWFMYDGWLYTTESLKTNMRRRGFREDITHSVSSNAYHMAFYFEKVIEREIVLLVISPKDQMVQIRLDSGFFGKDELIEYEMKSGEAKFVHIIIPPDEHTKVTWQEYTDPRIIMELEGEWKFRLGSDDFREKNDFDETEWESVTIPHSWNSRDIFDQRNIIDQLDIMEMYHRGTGWYRKTFDSRSDWENRRLDLSFLGANQVTEVWLNDEYLGKNTGGYLGFDFDVTDKIRMDAENILVVKVDNRFSYDIPPHTADFNFYGGLYREVLLTSTENIYLARTFTEGVDVSHKQASAQIVHNVENTSLENATGLTLTSNLLNPFGEIVQTHSREIEIPAGSNKEIHITMDPVEFPMLWSPESPSLYEVYTVLKDPQGELIDVNREPLGFRWYSFDADTGFMINDEPLKLKGVNFHQDYLNLGNAVDIRQKREDLIHIKNMGANFVRLAHYPHHPAVMDLTDSLGILVWSEIPWVNTTGGDEFARNAKDMMTRMIQRDFNHPSVILWGIGNEFAMGFIDDESLQRAKNLARELHDLSKSMDPNRLTVQAHNEIVDAELMEITDVQGRNRYYGWYEATYDDFANALDEEKEKYPDWNILISEYGAEGKYGYHVIDPVIFDHSETYQMNFHRAHWEAIDEREWVSGGALWNMFDFGSHVKIGNVPHINQKGMMTMDRKPKSVYRYYQSQWLADPVVYIVSETQHHKKINDDGTTEIMVFSNCEDVELIINGESEGLKTGEEGFIWHISPGVGMYSLEAVGSCRGIPVYDTHQVYYHTD
jgi:beta-galactosidase